MLEFLFGKKDNSVAIDEKINEIYSALKKAYPSENISDERKAELEKLIKENGYLPYPYIKA